VRHAERRKESEPPIPKEKQVFDFEGKHSLLDVGIVAH
jgi:hypothetical protein